MSHSRLSLVDIVAAEPPSDVSAAASAPPVTGWLAGWLTAACALTGRARSLSQNSAGASTEKWGREGLPVYDFCLFVCFNTVLVDFL